MTDWVYQIITGGGYAGIVFLMALENVVPPIPSEVIMGIGGIAVVHFGADIHPVGSQGNVVGIRSGTHGKHKAAAADVFLDLFDYFQFELGDLGKTQTARQGFHASLVFPIPGLGRAPAVKTPVLAGKIFVVKMQPVVFR